MTWFTYHKATSVPLLYINTSGVGIGDRPHNNHMLTQVSRKVLACEASVSALGPQMSVVYTTEHTGQTGSLQYIIIHITCFKELDIILIENEIKLECGNE